MPRWGWGRHSNEGGQEGTSGRAVGTQLVGKPKQVRNNLLVEKKDKHNVNSFRERDLCAQNTEAWDSSEDVDTKGKSFGLKAHQKGKTTNVSCTSTAEPSFSFSSPACQGFKLGSKEHPSIYPTLKNSDTSSLRSKGHLKSLGPNFSGKSDALDNKPEQPQHPGYDKAAGISSGQGEISKNDDIHRSHGSYGFCRAEDRPTLSCGLKPYHEHYEALADSSEDLSYFKINSNNLVNLDQDDTTDSKKTFNKTEKCKKKEMFEHGTGCQTETGGIFHDKKMVPAARKETSKEAGLHGVSCETGIKKSTVGTSSAFPEKRQTDYVPAQKMCVHESKSYTTPTSESSTNENDIRGKCDNVAVPSAPPSEDVSEASWSTHHIGYPQIGLPPILNFQKQSNFPDGFSQIPEVQHGHSMLSPCGHPVLQNQLFQETQRTEYAQDTQKHLPRLPSSIVRLIKEKHQHQYMQQQQQDHPCHQPAQFPIPVAASSLIAEGQGHLPPPLHYTLSPHCFSVKQQEPFEMASTTVQAQYTFSFKNSNSHQNLDSCQEKSIGTWAHISNDQAMQITEDEKNQSLPPFNLELKNSSTYQSCPKQETPSSDTLADLSSWNASLGQVPSSSMAIHKPSPGLPTATSMSSRGLRPDQQDSQDNLRNYQVLSSEIFSKPELTLNWPPNLSGGSRDHDNDVKEYKVQAQVSQDHARMPMPDSSSPTSRRVSMKRNTSQAGLEQLIMDAVGRAAQEATQCAKQPKDQQPAIMKSVSASSLSSTAQEEEHSAINVPSVLSEWVATAASMLPSLIQMEGYIDYTIDQLGHTLFSEIENLIIATYGVPSTKSRQKENNPTCSSYRAAEMVSSAVEDIQSDHGSIIQSYMNIQRNIKSCNPKSCSSEQEVGHLFLDTPHGKMPVTSPTSTVQNFKNNRAHLDHTGPLQDSKELAQTHFKARQNLDQISDQLSFSNISKVGQIVPVLDNFHFIALKNKENTADDSEYCTAITKTPQLSNDGLENRQEVRKSAFLMHSSPAKSCFQDQSINRTSGLSERTKAKLANLSLQYQQDNYSIPNSINAFNNMGYSCSESLGSTSGNQLRNNVDCQISSNKNIPSRKHGLDNLMGMLNGAASSGSSPFVAVQSQQNKPSRAHSSNTESPPHSALCNKILKKKKSCSRSHSMHLMTPGISRSQGHVGQSLYPCLDTSSFHALMPHLDTRRFCSVNARKNFNDEDNGTTSEILSSFIEEDAEDSSEDDTHLNEQTYSAFIDSSVSSALTQTIHTQGTHDEAPKNMPQACFYSEQNSGHSSFQNEGHNEAPLHVNPLSYDHCNKRLIQQEIKDLKTSTIETNAGKACSDSQPAPVKPQRPAPAVPEILAKQKASLLSQANKESLSQVTKSVESDAFKLPQVLTNLKTVPKRSAPPIPKEPTSVSKTLGPPNKGFVMRMTHAFDQTAQSASSSPPRTVYRPAPKALPQISWNSQSQSYKNPNTKRDVLPQPSRPTIEGRNPSFCGSYSKKRVPLLGQDSLPTSSRNSGTGSTSEALKRQTVTKSSLQIPPQPVISPTAKSELAQAKGLTRETQLNRADLGSNLQSPLKTPADNSKPTPAPSFKLYSATPFKRSNFPDKKRPEFKKTKLFPSQSKPSPQNMFNDSSRLSSQSLHGQHQPCSSSQIITCGGNQALLPPDNISTHKGYLPSLASVQNFHGATSAIKQESNLPSSSSTSKGVLPSEPTKSPRSKKGKKMQILEKAV